MASTFDFDSLVAVCLRTHEEMQHQAARSINLSLVVRNWLFGWYMVEYEQNGTDRAEYGTRFIETLATRLRQVGIKGGSRTRLQLYRSFYLTYRQIRSIVSGELGSGASLLPPLEIRPTVSGEFAMLPYRGERLPEGLLGSLANAFALSWSHYVTLLTIDDPDERRFYEIEAATNHWSVRELERQIASSLYERLEQFLLRCYVLIDLKRDKLTHEDLGQMQMYVNYFDRHVKLPDELPTVVIVLCRRKNDALVELTLPEDANIFAAKYQLYRGLRRSVPVAVRWPRMQVGRSLASAS